MTVPASSRPNLLRQWLAVFRACMQEYISYTAQAVIWIFTDVVGNILTLLVFLAAGQGRIIQGYSPQDFTLYFISLVGISGFVTCHMQWDVGLEIKDGMFSTYLLRPLSWYQFMVVKNLAWRLGRLTIFMPGLLLFVVLFWNLLHSATPHLGWEFWVSLVLGHGVSVSLVLAMSMTSLFVEDASALYEVYYLPMLFLSGQIFPISLLPHWAQNIGRALPFFYTTGAPVEILVGHLRGTEALWTIGTQCFWIIFCYLLFRILWARGTKRYTGTGM